MPRAAAASSARCSAPATSPSSRSAVSTCRPRASRSSATATSRSARAAIDGSSPRAASSAVRRSPSRLAVVAGLLAQGPRLLVQRDPVAQPGLVLLAEGRQRLRRRRGGSRRRPASSDARGAVGLVAGGPEQPRPARRRRPRRSRRRGRRPARRGPRWAAAALLLRGLHGGAGRGLLLAGDGVGGRARPAGGARRCRTPGRPRRRCSPRGELGGHAVQPVLAQPQPGLAGLLLGVGAGAHQVGRRGPAGGERVAASSPPAAGPRPRPRAASRPGQRRGGGAAPVAGRLQRGLAVRRRCRGGPAAAAPARSSVDDPPLERVGGGGQPVGLGLVAGQGVQAGRLVPLLAGQGGERGRGRHGGDRPARRPAGGRRSARRRPRPRRRPAARPGAVQLDSAAGPPR